MNSLSRDLKKLSINSNKPEDPKIEIEKSISFLKYYQENPLSDSASQWVNDSKIKKTDKEIEASILKNDPEKLNILANKTEDSQKAHENSKSEAENILESFDVLVEAINNGANKQENWRSSIENWPINIVNDIRSLKDSQKMMEVRYLIGNLGTCLENILDHKLYIERIDEKAINRTPIKRNVTIFSALIRLIMNLKDHNVIATLKFSNCQRYIWGIEINNDYARKLMIEVLASKGLRPKENGFLVTMFNEENFKRVLKKKAFDERYNKKALKKIEKYGKE